MFWVRPPNHFVKSIPVMPYLSCMLSGWCVAKEEQLTQQQERTITMEKHPWLWVCSHYGACFENEVEHLPTCAGIAYTPQFTCNEKVNSSTLPVAQIVSNLYSSFIVTWCFIFKVTWKYKFFIKRHYKIGFKFCDFVSPFQAEGSHSLAGLPGAKH